jgi:prepilin-type N-terminal cleavage/methylation domain-containing protein
MSKRGGFTLLEVLIAAAVSAVVLAAVFTVIFTTVRQDETLRVQMEMQIESARAMKEITSLLKQSGPVDVDRDNAFDPNVDWPIFATDVLKFDIEREPDDTSGTVPPGNFGTPLTDINTLRSGYHVDPALSTGHPALTPPYKLSVKNEDLPLGPTYFPENQASVEIAFKLPEDANGDGYPTNSTGGIEWSSDVYVICHEARSPVEWIENGNVLELRRYTPQAGGGYALVSRTILAHWVERVLFESRNSSFYQTGNYDPTLGVDQLRVTLWFRRNDVSRLREKQIAIKQVGTVMFRSVDR